MWSQSSRQSVPRPKFPIQAPHCFSKPHNFCPWSRILVQGSKSFQSPRMLVQASQCASEGVISGFALVGVFAPLARSRRRCRSWPWSGLGGPRLRRLSGLSGAERIGVAASPCRRCVWYHDKYGIPQTQCALTQKGGTNQTQWQPYNPLERKPHIFFLAPLSIIWGLQTSMRGLQTAASVAQDAGALLRIFGRTAPKFWSLDKHGLLRAFALLSGAGMSNLGLDK